MDTQLKSFHNVTETLSSTLPSVWLFFLQHTGSLTYGPLDTIAPYQAMWEEGLCQTLELLDPAVPFTQTQDISTCASCLTKGSVSGNLH